MPTLLEKRVVRQTTVLVEGVPLVITLEPMNALSLKLKQSRRVVYVPFLTLWETFATHVADNGKTVAQTPTLSQTVLTVLAQTDEPVHYMRVLEQVKRSHGKVNRPILREILRVLETKGLVEPVPPFRYRVKS